MTAGATALTTDILSRADGPHADTARRFVERTVCEECWTAATVDDDLCAGCIRHLEELTQRT